MKKVLIAGMLFASFGAQAFLVKIDVDKKELQKVCLERAQVIEDTEIEVRANRKSFDGREQELKALMDELLQREIRLKSRGPTTAEANEWMADRDSFNADRERFSRDVDANNNRVMSLQMENAKWLDDCGSMGK